MPLPTSITLEECRLTNLYIKKVNANIVVENRFKEGDTVYTKKDPLQKLIISRYVPWAYYCTIQEYPSKEEVIHFDSELTSEKQN